MKWLPSFFPLLLKTEVNASGECKIRLRGLGTTLLLLQFAQDRSSSDRALFYVRGGALARTTGRGRLEFREIVEKGTFLAAIHEFHPRAPLVCLQMDASYFARVGYAGFRLPLAQK